MRALLVDHDAPTHATLARAVRDFCRLDGVTRKDLCLERLQLEAYDAVIVCDRLGDGEGLELIVQIAQRHASLLRTFAAEPRRLLQMRGRLVPFNLFQTLHYPLRPTELRAMLRSAMAAQAANADTTNVQHIVLEGDAATDSESTQPQQPEEYVFGQTGSMQSQLPEGHAAGHAINRRSQGPEGHAAGRTINSQSQGPEGRAAGRAFNAQCQRQDGHAAGRTVNTQSQGSEGHAAGRAFNTQSQGPDGYAGGHAFNTQSQGPDGYAGGRAFNTQPQGPEGHGAGRAINAQSQGPEGHGAGRAINAQSQGPEGHAANRAINAQSQGPEGRAVGRAINTPSQGSEGHAAGRAINAQAQQPQHPAIGRATTTQSPRLEGHVPGRAMSTQSQLPDGHATGTAGNSQSQRPESHSTASTPSSRFKVANPAPINGVHSPPRLELAPDWKKHDGVPHPSAAPNTTQPSASEMLAGMKLPHWTIEGSSQTAADNTKGRKLASSAMSHAGAPQHLAHSRAVQDAAIAATKAVPSSRANARRVVIVLTRDKECLDTTVAALAGRAVSVMHAADEDFASKALKRYGAIAVLVDVTLANGSPQRLLDRICASGGGAPVFAAGRAIDIKHIAPLLSKRKVHRFLVKPMSRAQTRTAFESLLAITASADASNSLESVPFASLIDRVTANDLRSAIDNPAWHVQLIRLGKQHWHWALGGIALGLGAMFAIALTLS